MQEPLAAGGTLGLFLSLCAEGARFAIAQVEAMRACDLTSAPHCRRDVVKGWSR